MLRALCSAAAGPSSFSGELLSLRMGSRPSGLLVLLLLPSLLLLWQSARGQSSYIIDTVGLSIIPGSTVLSGMPVTVRCQVSVSHNNIPHLKQKFQLTRDDVLIYSSNTTEDSVEYELNPARAADSGNYECRVTIKDKSKTSIRQKLDVTGLQTPHLSLNNLRPYENEEFVATCSAPEEKGSLIFGFYQRFRSGEPVKMKQLVTNGNSTETTLRLMHIGDSFLFCDYEINLVSGTRRSNKSQEIQVIVKALSITPVMNVLPSTEVFEGDIVEVVCRVVGSPLKNIEVFLTKDRRILKQVGAPALSHQFVAEKGDSGELACKAEWGNVQKENYQTLTVKELFSNPRLTIEPKDLFEGDRFIMTCSVRIYVPEKISNESMRFSYYKDNVKVTSADSYISVGHPYKNGNYTCHAQATSVKHTFIKESQILLVKAKVPVSKPVLSVVGGTLLLGKPFQLRCHSDSGTLPITYTLHISDRMSQQRVVSRPEEEAIFDLSAIFKSSQLDNFVCHAKNSPRKPAVIETGHQLLRSTNIIEPVSEPVLSIYPNVGYVSEGENMTLVCSVQRGSPPINFTWYHTEKRNALHSQTYNKLQASFNIPNVKGEHGGHYYCVSTNQAKETKQSHSIMIGVKLAGWKKGVIGVICILFIVALILVVAFRRRLLQFKRKRSANLSVKSAGTKAERLSLTQAEVNEAANVTPGMMGKSIWSEHVSGSESDDQNPAPEKCEPQYTEVRTPEADPNKAPVKPGTDTVYSEVCTSTQGAPPPPPDTVSVEYAQLNHDIVPQSDLGNHGNNSDGAEHTAEVDHTVNADASNEHSDVGQQQEQRSE
ncbi:platelet endothelial cell adhesion molecule [Gouania willdenowi]|uniref:Platelet endothelial cell adhesion molecule n=1 Tax=Gouania willdenowi TaxID=441366 RepID=A0A8C5G9K6_GOUWI|nr:platelet endothelial cell adhesion molecule-like [Gouania willdenowi]